MDALYNLCFKTLLVYTSLNKVYASVNSSPFSYLVRLVVTY